MGRLTETTDALGNTTACSYDRAGNVTKIVECLSGANEAETAFTYDADGRLLTVKDADGSISAQTYDAAGNIASVTDAMGGTTSYSYDSMNRVTEVVNAIGAKNSYTYNGEGLLAESRNAGGSRTTYEYDAVGRIIRQKDQEGTITYTYDKNGNVLTVSDKDGTITRTYDALNRVTSVTDYKGDTIAYSYDQLGNRVSITYPGGEKVRYTYDRTGNLKTVTDAEGNVTYYTYDENGRLTETLRGDGSHETRSYDAAGHLLTLKDETAGGEVINDYAYEYDGRGNITKIEGMDGGTSASGHAAGEVTAASGGMTVDGKVNVSVSMTYDADNRLLTYNGQNVEYDAEGNMTKGPLNGGMAEFSYDCRNRLVKVKEADGTVTTYEYDAENVRTAKVTGGVRTEYTTDRESTYSQVLVKKEYGKNVFGLYTEQKAQTVYIYGTGLVSERRDGGEEFYYHYNHLGSTMAVSDRDGNVVYRFVYDTYGELSDIQNGNGISLQTAEEAQEYMLTELADAAGIEYLYNGKYGVTTDSNSLYYMRARYYNQDVKRFINRDVLSGDITNSQSLNRYCYVQGNPVSLTDPFGLCPTAEEIRKIEFKRKVHAVLDGLGIVFDVADVINAGFYAWEGDYENAIWSVLFLLPFVGSLIGLPIKYAFKWGGNAAEAFIKFTKKYVPELAENAGKYVRNIGGKLDDAGRWAKRKLDNAWKWIQKKLGRSITLKYKASSGVPLRSTPGKTTTILGKFENDTRFIIEELGIEKSVDFSGNPGGFNLLNAPDELYEQLGPDGFWEKYNKPFLDAAISRGDEILMATPINKDTLYNKLGNLTGYGREYYYLVEHGYQHVDGRMIFKGVN